MNNQMKSGSFGIGIYVKSKEVDNEIVVRK